MAARKRSKTNAIKDEKLSEQEKFEIDPQKSSKAQQKKRFDERIERKFRETAVALHFPPLPLVITILICSGFMWMLAFRDLMATGKSLFGPMDDAYLDFTQSKYWFDDSKGWRSSAGGLSAIKSITTDANRMGDLFVRKLAGAAGLGFYTQKLHPFLFHPNDAQWGDGHFFPLMVSSILANMSVIAFFMFYFEDLKGASADKFAILVISALLFESIMMIFYILARNPPSVSKLFSNKNKNINKSADSVTSRIVSRTVLLISGLITIIAGRDLFFPGHILPRVPRDDIYLEWTGAFVHSPPPGSPEEDIHSMEAPLHIGEKFASQLGALYMLVLCLYKFSTAFFVRYGSDGSGEIKCRMIWRVQTIAGCLVVFIFRMFASASLSASLDLRWHLMCLAYESFILGLHGYW